MSVLVRLTHFFFWRFLRSCWAVFLEDCACTSQPEPGAFQPQLPMTAPAITFFSNLNLDNFSCFIPKITLWRKRTAPVLMYYACLPFFVHFLSGFNRSTSTRSSLHYPPFRPVSLSEPLPQKIPSQLYVGQQTTDCYCSKNVSVCSYPGAQLQRKTSSSPPVFRIV